MKTKVTVRRTTVREKILNLLRKVGKPLDAKTIAKKGKLNYNTVRKELGILMQNLNVLPAITQGVNTRYYYFR